MTAAGWAARGSRDEKVTVRGRARERLSEGEERGSVQGSE
jgi:hypothetical protein